MVKQQRKDPLAWGIILIVVGLIFFLHNIDIKIWDTLARLWPVILIVWGGWKLYYGLRERRQQTGPKQD